MNRYVTNSRQQQQQQTVPMIKMQFEQLGKVIGKAWRALPQHQKRIIDVQAEVDRERYNKEMVVYINTKKGNDNEKKMISE
mmetsp:Transcript_41472/g.46228  ORF Transcript_41472/g.46228 Transcript_41472/m.46228 type:complete len:81 (+) Transcript_41472:27-269(+)